MLVEKLRGRRESTTFYPLALSLFLINIIKNDIRIEKYKVCQLKDKSNCSTLERQVLEYVK